MWFSNRYYTAIRCAFKNEEAVKVNPIDIYYDRAPQATYYQRYMAHKYQHTMQVLRAGIDVMNGDANLSALDDETKNKFMDALILHDIGRADDVAVDGDSELDIIHHAGLSMQRAVNLGEKDLRVLIPVLLHDRLNNNLLTLSDTELQNDKNYQTYPPEMRASLSDIRQRYLNSSDTDKKVIMQGLDLVRDADKLANLRQYTKMMNLSYFPKNPELSEGIIAQIHEHRMADFSLCKTYADEAMTYMAWSYGFVYSSAVAELQRKDINNKLAEISIQETQKEHPDKDLTLFAQKLHETAGYVDSVMQKKIAQANVLDKGENSAAVIQK